jgi:hypothetical protein
MDLAAVHTGNPALPGALGEVTGFVLEWNDNRAARRRLASINDAEITLAERRVV